MGCISPNSHKNSIHTNQQINSNYRVRMLYNRMVRTRNKIIIDIIFLFNVSLLCIPYFTFMVLRFHPGNINYFRNYDSSFYSCFDIIRYFWYTLDKSTLWGNARTMECNIAEKRFYACRGYTSLLLSTPIDINTSETTDFRWLLKKITSSSRVLDFFVQPISEVVYK